MNYETLYGVLLKNKKMLLLYSLRPKKTVVVEFKFCQKKTDVVEKYQFNMWNSPVKIQFVRCHRNFSKQTETCHAPCFQKSPRRGATDAPAACTRPVLFPPLRVPTDSSTRTPLPWRPDPNPFAAESPINGGVGLHLLHHQ